MLEAVDERRHKARGSLLCTGWSSNQRYPTKKQGNINYVSFFGYIGNFSNLLPGPKSWVPVNGKMETDKDIAGQKMETHFCKQTRS